MKKIMFYDSVADRYGSAYIARLALRALVDAEYTVKPYTCRNYLMKNEAYATLDENLPLIVRGNFKKRLFFSILDIYRKTVWYATIGYKSHDTASADIVYINTFSAILIGVVAKIKNKKAKTVLHIHESAPNKIVAFCARIIFKLFYDKVIFVSDASQKTWGYFNRKAVMIHNGIDDNYSRKNIPQINGRTFDFLFIGRLTAQKGIDIYLKCVKRLYFEYGTKYKCALVGGYVPGASQVYNEEIMELQEFGILEFLGERNKTSDIISRSKILCVPSRYIDPFPTVVLEGLSAGCFVVASNRGGAKEALFETQSLVSKRLSSDDFYRIMVAGINDCDQSVVRDNRQSFLKKYEYERFARELIDNID